MSMRIYGDRWPPHNMVVLSVKEGGMKSTTLVDLSEAEDCQDACGSPHEWEIVLQ